MTAVLERRTGLSKIKFRSSPLRKMREGGIPITCQKVFDMCSMVWPPEPSWSPSLTTWCPKQDRTRHKCTNTYILHIMHTLQVCFDAATKMIRSYNWIYFFSNARKLLDCVVCLYNYIQWLKTASASDFQENHSYKWHCHSFLPPLHLQHITHKVPSLDLFFFDIDARHVLLSNNE